MGGLGYVSWFFFLGRKFRRWGEVSSVFYDLELCSGRVNYRVINIGFKWVILVREVLVV